MFLPNIVSLFVYSSSSTSPVLGISAELLNPPTSVVVVVEFLSYGNGRGLRYTTVTAETSQSWRLRSVRQVQTSKEWANLSFSPRTTPPPPSNIVFCANISIFLSGETALVIGIPGNVCSRIPCTRDGIPKQTVLLPSFSSLQLRLREISN